MVYISPHGVPTAIQGGVYAIGVDGYGGFSQHEWHHNLHIGSSIGIVTVLFDLTSADMSVFLIFLSCFRLCVFGYVHQAM